VGERLERASEATFGFFRGARHAFHLTFGAGEETDQQVSFSQWIAAEDDGFRVFEHLRH